MCNRHTPLLLQDSSCIVLFCFCIMLSSPYIYLFTFCFIWRWNHSNTTSSLSLKVADNKVSLIDTIVALLR